eukprot:3297770-Rhodomonas_salina.3
MRLNQRSLTRLSGPSTTFHHLSQPVAVPSYRPASEGCGDGTSPHVRSAVLTTAQAESHVRDSAQSHGFDHRAGSRVLTTAQAHDIFTRGSCELRLWARVPQAFPGPEPFVLGGFTKPNGFTQPKRRC